MPYFLTNRWVLRMLLMECQRDGDWLALKK